MKRLDEYFGRIRFRGSVVLSALVLVSLLIIWCFAFEVWEDTSTSSANGYFVLAEPPAGSLGLVPGSQIEFEQKQKFLPNQRCPVIILTKLSFRSQSSSQMWERDSANYNILLAEFENAGVGVLAGKPLFQFIGSNLLQRLMVAWPGWALAVLSIIYWWRRDSRIKRARKMLASHRSHCLGCSYEIAGDTRCPECGAAPTARRRALFDMVRRTILV